MAKDKERSVNPAQQARKQEKNRALKRAKNEQQARRNEKLARRNPDRLQSQIDDLKALESSGEIKPREKAILADLERDLRAVKKAREVLGDKAPRFENGRPRNDHADLSNGQGKGGVLGKRGRDGERRQTNSARDQEIDSGGETDESVRAIPMPRDTPPPMPRESRRNNQQRYHGHDLDADSQDPSEAPSKVQPVEHKTTYSSAPQLRDLRKEATSRFVPSAVKRKQDAVKGVSGSLLEPEEMDKLEAAGYFKVQDDDVAIGSRSDFTGNKDETKERRLDEEVARFEKELAAAGDMDVDLEIQSQSAIASRHSKPHRVEIEEVEDEDL